MLRFVLVLLCLLSNGLRAQESRGAITGRVADAQAAIIPGARVAVTNTATNDTRRAATNPTGYYEFNYLEPGLYTVTVEAAASRRRYGPVCRCRWARAWRLTSRSRSGWWPRPWR